MVQEGCTTLHMKCLKRSGMFDILLLGVMMWLIGETRKSCLQLHSVTWTAGRTAFWGVGCHPKLSDRHKNGHFAFVLLILLWATSCG